MLKGAYHHDNHYPQPFNCKKYQQESLSLICFFKSSSFSASRLTSMSLLDPEASSEQLWVLEGICALPLIGTPSTTGVAQVLRSSLWAVRLQDEQFQDLCGQSAPAIRGCKQRNVFQSMNLHVYIMHQPLNKGFGSNTFKDIMVWTHVVEAPFLIDLRSQARVPESLKFWRNDPFWNIQKNHESTYFLRVFLREITSLLRINTSLVRGTL